MVHTLEGDVAFAYLQYKYTYYHRIHHTGAISIYEYTVLTYNEYYNIHISYIVLPYE